MAHCVKEQTLPEPPPATYHLNLSQEEAEFLWVLLGQTGGKCGSGEDFAYDVYNTLDEALDMEGPGRWGVGLDAYNHKYLDGLWSSYVPQRHRTLR